MSLEQFLAVIAAGISIGMGWASVKYFIEKKNGNAGRNRDERYEDLAIEIQAIKVLLLGVQGQGGLVMEIRDLRLGKHDTNNAIQLLQNKMYIVEQRVNQLDIRMEGD